VDSAGTLELIAELAVAFAGFTGLVGAFRLGSLNDPGTRLELRVLIEFSLITLILALIPLFLHEIGISEALKWRISTLCAASASPVFLLPAHLQTLL
jgi:hypothetical protein